MTDPTAQAKSAREILSQALRALQSDPTVPASLSAVAEPVAQAMGALHAIERSGSVATAPAARDAIRAALGLLQQQSTPHPAVGTATEAVASSLGLVFQLVKLGEAQPAAAAPVAAPPPVAAPQPAFQQPTPQPAFQQPAPQPAFQQPAPQPAFQQPAPQPAFQQPAPQPAANPYVNPFPSPQAAAPAPAPQAAKPAAPAGDMMRFDASLGTSSNTNFYKGLSGNDVVEHGGLFIATYSKIPKIGATVSLHVSLPGGYEFDALAVVAWTRAGADSDAQPGFGARLTQVTPEARQLIYRYTRNREPLFHDDL